MATSGSTRPEGTHGCSSPHPAREHRALTSLTQALDELWRDCVKDGSYSSDATDPSSFLDECISPTHVQEKEAWHHEAIKSQALGEGFQAWKLLPLSRYETQLD